MLLQKNADEYATESQSEWEESDIRCVTAKRNL